ncbi:hypothetical protein ACQB6R_07405 [Propionibacteriaceae bacterium G1746]
MKAEDFTWAVANIDQRRSSSSPDRVPALLTMLATHDLALPAERTAGDEVQLLTRSAQTLAAVLEFVAREGHWRIGIGFGLVEYPLPAHVRESRGGAFVAARTAVDRAHSSASDLAFVTGGHTGRDVTAPRYAGDDAQDVAAAQAVAGLLHHLWSRRTKEGWAVVDALRAEGTGRAAAEALGISPSAVSQRLRTAGWQPGDEGRALLVQLFERVLRVGETLGPA